MGKSIYFILVGTGILVMSLNQNANTRAFEKRGKQAEAQAASNTYTEVKVRERGPAGHIKREFVELDLKFTTESGELIIVKKEITDEMLATLIRNKSLPIRYVSDKPTKTRLSNESNDDGMGGILFGAAVLLFGILWYWIVYLWENRSAPPRKKVQTARRH